MELKVNFGAKKILRSTHCFFVILIFFSKNCQNPIIFMDFNILLLDFNFMFSKNSFHVPSYMLLHTRGIFYTTIFPLHAQSLLRCRSLPILKLSYYAYLQIALKPIRKEETWGHRSKTPPDHVSFSLMCIVQLPPPVWFVHSQFSIIIGFHEILSLESTSH